MTTIPYGASYDDARSSLRVRALTGWMAVAGLASLGAGAIHAAAIGVHAEHKPAAVTFAILAALQLAWGALALVRSNRLVAFLGLAVNVGTVVGWVWAKKWGISFIPGLDIAEPIQTADGLAAGLAGASALLIGLSVWTSRESSTPARPPMVVASLGITGLTVFGMIATGAHVHSHNHANNTIVVEQTQGPAVVVPFDPNKPIDFGGAPDTTPRQQAFAENLVAATLRYLPMWSDPDYALAHGFASIGDGGTGVEHFVNPAFQHDDNYLDPTHPESLVWDTSGGGRRLVAAMYMLDQGEELADVPNYGGALMQFHIHNNLCFTDDGHVAGLTDGDGNCPAGLAAPLPTPMIHVWLENQTCGPFAALEGIGGGQIAEGETVNCDHQHGGTTT